MSTNIINMVPYHLTYTNFMESELAATDAFFAAKPFRGSEKEKLQKFKIWTQAMSEIYEVESPTLIVKPFTPDNILGYYKPELQLIVLQDFWVSVLFHEFRHHLQFSQRVSINPYDVHQAEHDTRAWSHSLYYIVRPKMFLKALKEDKIGPKVEYPQNKPENQKVGEVAVGGSV